jgi:hypothetical protein
MWRALEINNNMENIVIRASPPTIIKLCIVQDILDEVHLVNTTPTNPPNHPLLKISRFSSKYLIISKQ